MKFEEDERRRNEEEAALSRDLIETIQRIEEQERLEKERLALSDEALAKELDGAFKEVNRTCFEGHPTFSKHSVVKGMVSLDAGLFSKEY